jgi:hypothetical protein
MHGNWLQDLLNWYWITPWQLGLIEAPIVGAGVWGGMRIGRRR